MSNADKLLELFQSIPGMYLAVEDAEKRKLLEMVVSNSRVKDGELEYEFRKAFGILVDGVEEEEKLIAQNAPIEERNEIWLPRQDSNLQPSG